MRARSFQDGLTLVEVLVALAILGMVVAAIIALIGQNARFLSASEERMIAGILADNEMTAALARTAPLERGDEVRETQFGGRDWVVERRVIDAGVDSVVRVEIDVRTVAGMQIAASAMTLKAERQP